MPDDARSRACYRRRVTKQDLVDAWRVDLANGLATCGAVVIRFNLCLEQGMQLAFVEGAGDSLETQCELAGEALAAIQRAGRRHGIQL